MQHHLSFHNLVGPLYFPAFHSLGHAVGQCEIHECVLAVLLLGDSYSLPWSTIAHSTPGYLKQTKDCKIPVKHVHVLLSMTHIP